MINRQAALFSDALLTSLSTFATAGSSQARHGGEPIESSTLTILQSKTPKKALPNSESTEYTLLAVHAAYAWALVCLLHAKVYLMTVYNLSDDRVSRYDPDGAVNRGNDRPATPLYTLHTAELAVLPSLPNQILYALSGGKEGNSGLVFDEMDDDNNSSTTLSLSSNKQQTIKRSLSSSLSSVAHTNSRGLHGDILQTVITELDNILTETANDFSATLPNAMRRRGAGKKGSGKRKLANDDHPEETGDNTGGVNEENTNESMDNNTKSSKKSASKGTKKGKGGTKRKKRDEDDDDDDDDDDVDDEEEEVIPVVKGKGKNSKVESTITSSTTTITTTKIDSANKRTKDEGKEIEKSTSSNNSNKKASARKGGK